MEVERQIVRRSPVKRRRNGRKGRGRRVRQRNFRFPAATNNNAGLITTLRFLRVVLSSLPISGITTLTALFDFGFNLFAKTIGQQKSILGAYGMIGITPGSVLNNSPLLAEIGGGRYSFPGYPVSMRNLRIVLRNTTQMQERAGKWAAVLVPYRENHDAAHYTEALKTLTFQQLASMPHARSATANRNLIISYTMRDRTNYCARPRELGEEIAVLFVAWDNSARDDTGLKTNFTNSSFNCEIELTGRCSPHPVFGAHHRVEYPATTFNIVAKTKGDTVRVEEEPGVFRFWEYDEFMLSQRMRRQL